LSATFDSELPPALRVGLARSQPLQLAGYGLQQLAEVEHLAIEVAGLVGVHAPEILAERGGSGHAKAEFTLGRSTS
jgi:hypothetical protein